MMIVSILEHFYRGFKSLRKPFPLQLPFYDEHFKSTTRMLQLKAIHSISVLFAHG